ncbi:hypothetical protein GCM10027570_04380 [Streptomonospora sediminis]
MLRRTAAWVGAACAAALVSAAPAAPASAEEPSSTFEITVERASTGTLDRYWLNCNPDFGTHPRPQAACERLRSGGGELERMRSGSALCPSTKAPVDVRIVGNWRGTPTEFNEQYPNDCYARVFAEPVVPHAPAHR